MKRLLPIFIILSFILYVLASAMSSRKEKFAGMTAQARHATGVSIFAELAERLNPGQIKLSKSAILSNQDLNQIGALLVLSPKLPVSRREAEIIKGFVKSGGQLIISFHDKTSLKNLRSLHKALKLPVVTGNWPEFENRKPHVVTAEEGSSYFERGQQYAFYSLLLIKNANCRDGNIACFVKEQQIGKGRTTIIAGLPPLSNGLINIANNADFAFKLLELPGIILIDEYRQLFTERSITDLLLSPTFVLPLLGMFLGAVLFFLFGRQNTIQNTTGVTSRWRSVSHHDLSNSILRGIIEKNPKALISAVPKQAEFLTKLFPEQEQKISKLKRAKGYQISQAEALQLSWSLIKLHQRFLMDKGAIIK